MKTDSGTIDDEDPRLRPDLSTRHHRDHVLEAQARLAGDLNMPVLRAQLDDAHLHLQLEIAVQDLDLHHQPRAEDGRGLYPPTVHLRRLSVVDTPLLEAGRQIAGRTRDLRRYRRAPQGIRGTRDHSHARALRDVTEQDGLAVGAGVFQPATVAAGAEIDDH